MQVRKIILWIFLLLLSNKFLKAQDLPLGWVIHYEQDFSSSSAINDFEFTDPAVWQIQRSGNNSYLELTGQSDYTPPYRSPCNIALISGEIFGDFILEAMLKQSVKEDEQGDMIIVFAMKDSSHFYYAHLDANPNATTRNVFSVNEAPRLPAGDPLTKGIIWEKDKWHKIRLERDIVRGSIKVFFDNMQKPVIQIVDRTHILGYIGFGSYEGTGQVDNIKIWAPTSIEKKAEIFNEAIKDQ